MAKGQKRSNREVKKPKKSAGDKKSAAAPSFVPAPAGARKPGGKAR